MVGDFFHDKTNLQIVGRSLKIKRSWLSASKAVLAASDCTSIQLVANECLSWRKVHCDLLWNRTEVLAS